MAAVVECPSPLARQGELREPGQMPAVASGPAPSIPSDFYLDRSDNQRQAFCLLKASLPLPFWNKNVGGCAYHPWGPPHTSAATVIEMIRSSPAPWFPQGGTRTGVPRSLPAVPRWWRGLVLPAPFCPSILGLHNTFPACHSGLNMVRGTKRLPYL